MINRNKLIIGMAIVITVFCLCAALCGLLISTPDRVEETCVPNSMPTDTLTPTLVPTDTPTATPMGTPADTPIPIPVINTATAIPVPTVGKWDCSGDKYNCKNFGSQQEAQDYFNSCPGDPGKLDRDKDGSVYEGN